MPVKSAPPPAAPSPVPGTKRRGRPPLPEDNQTRESLLNAALKLFAHRSYADVSVREINDAAGQSPAASNYHFGSKEGLFRALVLRATPQLMAERLALLQEAMRRPAGRARLRGVLFALIAPVIRWSRQPGTQAWIVPLLQRARLDGPEEIRKLLGDDASHLSPFVAALRELFPDLPQSEIGWRLHFVLGIEHAVHYEPHRLEALIGGTQGLDDPEGIANRVIDFVEKGWPAPAGRRPGAAG